MKHVTLKFGWVLTIITLLSLRGELFWKERPQDVTRDVTVHEKSKGLPLEQFHGIQFPETKTSRVNEQTPPSQSSEIYPQARREASRREVGQLKAKLRHGKSEWKTRLGPYISARPFAISSKPFFLINGVRAFPETQSLDTETEIVRVGGYSFRESRGKGEGNLVLYDAEHDFIVLVTGKLVVKVDDLKIIPDLESRLGEKASGVDADLKLVFIQAKAQTLPELSELLERTREIRGVREARLDLVGPRAVPQ